MTTSIERIQVRLELIRKGFNKSMNATNNKMQQVSKKMSGFNNVMSMNFDQWRNMNKAAKMNTQEFKKFGKSMDTSALQEFGLRMRKSGDFATAHGNKVMGAKRAQDKMTAGLQTSGGRMANSVRQVTHGMKGFRMEALGVMFFGQMLQQTFMSLLNPVMEAFGVFDLFRLMLLTLFLPIMEDIFPHMLKIINWFIELPESTKKALGVLVLVGIILGFLLFIIGAFTLGIGSLILFIAMLGAVGLSISGLGLVFLALVAIVAIAWKSIAFIIGGFINIIMGIIDIFIGLFTGNLEKLRNGIKLIFIGIIKTIVGVIGIILQIIFFILKLIIHGILGFFKLIFDAFFKLGTWLKNVSKDLSNSLKIWGINMIKKLAEGISSMTSKVKDAILNLFPPWARKLIWSAGKFVISIFSRNKTENNGTTGSIKRVNDFVMRPGLDPISIHPNDTLVGFKGAPPNLGGGNEVNITNNYHGFTKDDLLRELDNRDSKIVNDIQRLVKE